MGFRGATVLFLLGVAACGSSDSAASDSSDLEQGRGVLTRQLSPALAIPTSALIGAKIADIAASTPATAGAAVASTDCTTTPFTDGAGAVVYQKVDCKGSTTIRFLAANGTATYEHADLNKDGLVDRYSSSVATDAVAQYTDANYDGHIDVVAERVGLLKDFSLDGYGESYPQSAFLFRIREDRNRDGQLDFETLTARGALPTK